MLDTEHFRREVISDLYAWGPALTKDLRSRYPASVIRDLLLVGVIAKHKYVGFEVYVLTGKGLRPYGYSFRYNYEPARNTVVGALMLRAQACRFRNDGYTVELYDDYVQKGRGNIALITKDNVVSGLVARSSITLKALRMITVHLLDAVPQVTDLQVFVLQGDHDPYLMPTRTIKDLPVTITEVRLGDITREPFKPYGSAAEDGVQSE